MSSEKKTSETVKIMYDTAMELEATDGHFTMNKIFGNEQASGVVSAYIGIKPDHLVMQDLIEWAEENNNQELLDKIEELRSDLSFLEEANVFVE